jgi:hypothetical protein
VQRALGFKGKAVDGDYGPDTAGAVEEWKWRVGYPKRQINNRLGLLGIAWLLGEVPFPGHFARNAKARKGKPYAFANGIVRPPSTSPGFRSEFELADGEGAPDRNGTASNTMPGRTGSRRVGARSGRPWPGRSSRRSCVRRPQGRSSVAA